jgi:hypothetical protein
MRQLRPYLYQGDDSDLNLLKLELIRKKYGLTLAINVGSMNFVPRGMFSIHLPMVDDTLNTNDWIRVLEVLSLAVDEIHHGGKILVSCNAGLSRSVVFAGMLISVLERKPMDDELMQRVRSPVMDPLPELWAHARNALQMWWTE